MKLEPNKGAWDAFYVNYLWGPVAQLVEYPAHNGTVARAIRVGAFV